MEAQSHTYADDPPTHQKMNNLLRSKALHLKDGWTALMVACVSVSMHVEASSFTAQRRCAPGALLAQTSRRGGRRRRSCRVGEAPKRSTVRDAEADRASSSGVGCRAVSDVANGVVARRFTRRKKDVGYEKALRHWRSCEYDLARQSFEEFLDEKPMHSLAWVSYSRLVLSQSGFKAARRVLFKGIQNAGTYGSGYVVPFTDTDNVDLR